MDIQHLHESVCAKARAHGYAPETLRLQIRANFMSSHPPVAHEFVAWWSFPRQQGWHDFPVMMGHGTTMEAAIESAYQLIIEAP